MWSVVKRLKHVRWFLYVSIISSVHPGSRWLRSDRYERCPYHPIGQSEADPRSEPLRRPVRSAGDVQLQQEPDVSDAQLHQRAETAAAQQSDRYEHKHLPWTQRKTRFPRTWTDLVGSSRGLGVQSFPSEYTEWMCTAGSLCWPLILNTDI